MAYVFDGRRSMILVDATPLQSEHRFRGVGTYTRRLVHELELLRPGAFGYVATTADRRLLPPEVAAAAVTGYRPHRPAQVYWLYNEWFLRRIVHRTRPALFHATDFNGAIRVRGVPTVTTLYDLTTLREGFHHQGLSARLSDLRWWVYYYRKLPGADHIIAISEDAKRDAVQLLGIPEERITAIPLGVDRSRFQPGRGGGRYAAEPSYLLFIGGRMVNKNLDRVIDAFSQVASDVPELQLYLGGSWREADAAWLQGLCRDSGVRGRIRPLGFVPEADLPSLYANALAFVFPSLAEGFGLPVLEAMASGVPVITSNTGALLEVAGDAALLVNPLDTADLVNAIGRVTGDAVLRGDMQRRGLERVQAFSWEEVAQRTLHVYDRVLA